jgi:2-oxoglutarate ferredoxin oxidoreductase subunit alpha
MSQVEIERGKIADEDTVAEYQDEEGRFQPHLPTEDGISPRAFPGTEGGNHMSTGLEHSELGRRNEDVDIRVEQVKKRERKVETAREREDWSPRSYGDPDSDTLVISWGSNEGAILEAMDFMEEDDLHVQFISVPYIFPRPDLSEEIESAETTIVVEANSMGQFADLLEHDVLTRVERINKYNGVPFNADELAEQISEIATRTEEVEA